MTDSYKLVVFDWDGTLMDSTAHIVASMQGAITDLNAEWRDARAVRNIIGLGLGEAIQALYPEADAAFVQRFADRYRHYFFTDDSSVLFPGVAETLEHLLEAGYFLGVATGKSRRGLDRVLNQLGMQGVFHATRCADETRSKPHPQMLEEVMDIVGVGAKETLMVGDSEYDMLLARNAGASPVAVSYGAHEPERLLRHEPLMLLDAVSELAAWLTETRTGQEKAVSSVLS